MTYMTEEEKKDLISFAQDIIKIKSYSGKEKEVAERIKLEMQKLGYDEILEDGSGSVIGVLGNGPYHLLFDSHMDTVAVTEEAKWDYPPFGAQIDDGKLYGRGASDMKSSLAASVYAGAMMKKNGALEGKTVRPGLRRMEGLVKTNLQHFQPYSGSLGQRFHFFRGQTEQFFFGREMEIDVRWDRLDRLLLLFHQFLIKMTGVAFLCLLPQIPEIPVIHFRQRFHNDLPGKIGLHERKISEVLRLMLVFCPCNDRVFVGLCQIFHDQLDLLIFRSRELFRNFFDVRQKSGIGCTQCVWIIALSS